MRIGFILGVLALTAVVFFVAIQSLVLGPAKTAAQTELALAADKAKLTETLEANSGLRTALAELEETNSTLQSTLSDSQAEKEKLEVDLAALKTTEAQSAELEAENLALSDSIAALQDELSAATTASESFQSEAQAKSAEVTKVQAQIAELQTTIADLESARDQSAARIAELSDELKAAADAANTGPSESQSQVIAERDAALAELANLKNDNEDQSGFTSEMTELVGAMRQRIAKLQTEVADRETEIAALSSSAQVPTESPAAVCQSRTDALAGAINFEGGATAISAESASLLEELSGIVAECAQDSVLLEIEGHTGSGGGDASNLLLSNARANAVLAFLAERGVPASSMRAVGFGSSDPVADNATAEGRSLNQRIVFDWEMK